MRKINEIIVHCTGTRPDSSTTVEVVRKYHIQHNGWRDIGYHFLIYTDGTVHKGRPISQVGAHCSGHNTNTIGICYVGGKSVLNAAVDTRTPAQKQALRNLIATLKAVYPSINKVSSHHDYNKAKPCPCFDATSEYMQLVK